MLKKFIAEKLVKPFKACGVFGRQRFWMLYWAYRLTGWHIRHKEWDYVLEYFPPLEKCQTVSVLDVGCSRNLFCYELQARGYIVDGVDVEPFQEKFPGVFHQCDIRHFVPRASTHRSFTETKNLLQSYYDSQKEMLKMQGNAKSAQQKILQNMSCRIYAQLEKKPSFDKRAKTKNELSKLLENLFKEGKVDEKALRNLFESQCGGASCGLQEAIGNTLALPSASSGISQQGEHGNLYDFVTCISVLEHIEDWQPEAVISMINCLKIRGRLILTIPTLEFAQGHPWHGFACMDISAMISGRALIVHAEEHAGQHCLTIERTT